MFCWRGLSKSCCPSKLFDINALKTFFNPFHAIGPFLYPLKKSENKRFSDIFRMYKKRQAVAWNGLKLQGFEASKPHHIFWLFRKIWKKIQHNFLAFDIRYKNVEVNGVKCNVNMDLFFQLNVSKNWKNKLQGYCGQYYHPILLLYFKFFILFRTIYQKVLVLLIFFLNSCDFLILTLKK